MNKIKKYIGLLSVVFAAVGAYIVSAVSANAAVPSATSTLDTIMESIIGTTVSLAQTLFTTYWPYVLVFGIIAALVGIFMRFLHKSAGGGRK